MKTSKKRKRSWKQHQGSNFCLNPLGASRASVEELLACFLAGGKLAGWLAGSLHCLNDLGGQPASERGNHPAKAANFQSAKHPASKKSNRCWPVSAPTKPGASLPASKQAREPSQPARQLANVPNVKTQKCNKMLIQQAFFPKRYFDNPNALRNTKIETFKKCADKTVNLK